MAIYTLKKIKNEEGGQTDARGKKVLFYRGAESRIACGRDQRGAKTGLTKEEEAYFEKELRLKEGELHVSSDYWHNWNRKVDVNGLRLDDEYPQDRLDLKVLQQREHISHKEGAGILFILTSEDYEAKQNVDTRSYKAKAYVHYSNMTPEEHVAYLTAKGRRTKGLSPDKIKELVSDDVELAPKQFLEDVEDRDKDLKAFIYELVHTGLLIKDATSFRDKESKEVLGRTLDSVIDYLKDGENQAYYITLQKALARAKKAK
jgi:hypothetical protein